MRTIGLLILLLVSSSLFVGCASNPAVQLYAGDARPASEIVTVQIPRQLQVIAINGQEVSGVNRFFSADHRDLELAPGRYRIVARYKALWDLSPVEHTTVKSGPAAFVLDGKAGQQYVLGYDHPDSLKQARALAGHFSGWVENVANGDRTPSQPSRLASRNGIVQRLVGSSESALSSAETVVIPSPERSGAGSDAVSDSEADDAVDSEPAPAMPAESDAGSYLDVLKAEWTQATPEERRAFLRWISARK